LICDEDCLKIKIVDFGSSCKVNEQVYTYVQSRFYRAPEVVLRIPYTGKVDIWSLGCIVAELFSGDPIFPASSEQELLEFMMEIKGIPSQQLLKLSRKASEYFDDDGSPFLIDDQVKGILRVPDTKPLAFAV
jgi:dual specificity tyrosine-phosphorylation-regulated kinase 2/3/4